MIFQFCTSYGLGGRINYLPTLRYAVINICTKAFIIATSTLDQGGFVASISLHLQTREQEVLNRQLPFGGE